MENTKSMALLVLVFVVCCTPFFLYMFVLQLCRFMDITFEKKFYPENPKIFYFCLLCGFTNLCINPFLYYWPNKNIRLGIQWFIMNKLCKKKGKVTDSRISKMARSTHTTHVKCSEKRSTVFNSKNSSYKKDKALTVWLNDAFWKLLGQCRSKDDKDFLVLMQTYCSDYSNSCRKACFMIYLNLRTS